MLSAGETPGSSSLRIRALRTTQGDGKSVLANSSSFHFLGLPFIGKSARLHLVAEERKKALQVTEVQVCSAPVCERVEELPRRRLHEHHRRQQGDLALQDALFYLGDLRLQPHRAGPADECDG